MPEHALAQLRDRIVAADAARRPLRLRGGGTKDFYGETPAGDVLDTRGFAGIVSYEPTELVITARAGTPLGEMQAALAEKGQMLAFEPPAFGAQATVGGMVACGLSGPRRMAAGAARDFVLGAALLTAQGELLYFGGQVMKNVAGYDVSRLLCGSLGILGLIAEVSLKVLPVPAAQATVRMALDGATALRRMNEWAGQPLPISASTWADGTLDLRLSGARAAVQAAVARFRDTQGALELDAPAATALWEGIREHTDPLFDGPAPLWRLSVPTTAPLFEFPGRQRIEWGGGLRWLKTDAEAAVVRRAAANVGGSATLFRGGDRSAGVFPPLPEAVLRIHQRLKREFDPHGIFNPGRLVAGL
jgi:glycolate oxidase FAD binding subunit